MAIIEYKCLKPSLFFYGAFKLMEYPTKIAPTLDYLYSEIFITPWDNWHLIKRIFESFGSSGTVSNASFSKNDNIGDGIKTPWRLNTVSNGVLVQCYNMADELGILVDSTTSKITFTVDPDEAENIARKKWQAMAIQYQIIKDIQTSQIITGYGVTTTIDSYDEDNITNVLDRSPQQLDMYQGNLTKTAISTNEQFGANLDESSLYKVSHDTLNYLFSDVIDTLRNGWWYDLLKLNVVNVEYEDQYTTHEIDSVDISNGYVDFDCGSDQVAHVEYLINDPTAVDTTAPFFAVTCDSSPYIIIYNSFRNKLDNPSVLPTGAAKGAAFSPDGSLLAVAHASSPYITIYNTDDWSKLSNPSTLPTGQAYSVRFSLDGSRLAVGHVSSPYLTIYKVSDWSSESPNTLPTSTIYRLTFNGINTRLAVCQIGTSPYIRVYFGSRFIYDTDAPSVSATCVAYKDNEIIAVGTGSSPYIKLYTIEENIAGIVYVPISNPSILPTGQVNGAEFSPDGSLLALSHENSPYVTIYNTSDWSKVDNPLVLPTGTGSTVKFNNSGTILVVSHYNSPYITMYNTSNWSKINNPSTLPTNLVWDVSFYGG